MHLTAECRVRGPRPPAHGPREGSSCRHREQKLPAPNHSGAVSVEARAAGGHCGPLVEEGCPREGQCRANSAGTWPDRRHCRGLAGWALPRCPQALSCPEGCCALSVAGACSPSFFRDWPWAMGIALAKVENYLGDDGWPSPLGVGGNARSPSWVRTSWNVPEGSGEGAFHGLVPEIAPVLGSSSSCPVSSVPRHLPSTLPHCSPSARIPNNIGPTLGAPELRLLSCSPLPFILTTPALGRPPTCIAAS